MKKLQNNFTTPEQSKRLLELGVPADSADCYINLWNNYPYGILAEDESYSDYKFAGYMNDSKVLPCWSVGRLIEILEIILGTPWSDHEELGKSTLIERVLRDFEDVVKYKEIFKDSRIDFSKLEE
jgi:hypothetical protein